MLKGLYILGEDNYKKIYGPEERKDISNYVDIYAEPQTSQSVFDNSDLLADLEVIFSGWGGPKIDEEFLKLAPNLKMVFYGAGSIKGIVTEAFWDRGIRITSSYAANGVPVAEYTLSQILFSLKRGWSYVQKIKEKEEYLHKGNFPDVPGAYRSTVGIISLGMIGRMVCEHLKGFDIKVLAYDPFVDEKDAAELGVELCSLDDIFKRSDVVSLHTPWLKETEGMITAEHFKMMKENATFINTARGAVVREEEMLEVLKTRQDIYALLDVTYPEPPKKDSAIFNLPNVVLTPHIAGSMDRECWRMGRYMVEELERYLEGEPLKWVISREKAKILA